MAVIMSSETAACKPVDEGNSLPPLFSNLIVHLNLIPMKHEKHPKSFRADDFCTTCDRTTRHAVTVLGENETTVRNSRSCDACGTRLNYFSPVGFFKLLAAGAILSLFLIYLG